MGLGLKSLQQCSPRVLEVDGSFVYSTSYHKAEVIATDLATVISDEHHPTHMG
jgi:hypothetical protein